MKITKSLLAVSVLAGAVQTANATDVVGITITSGTLLGQKTVGATVNPTLVLHAGSTAYNINASSQVLPTFLGSFTFNLLNNAVGGNFADFVQYSTSINAGLLGGTAVVNQPDNVFNFKNGTTGTYNVATRTLTIGQALNYAAASGTSDVSLAAVGTPGVCTGGSNVCNGQTTWFLNSPSKPNASDIERFYLTLTFAPDLHTFTGTAVGVDVGGALPLGNTGNTWYNYSFSGTAVPVPAAAWLFGSGLMGLAGVARRRRAV